MSKLRHYETMFIVKPTLTEEETAAQIDGIKAIIEKNGGEIVQCDNMGSQQLAYEIEKQFHGNKCAAEAEEHFTRVFQKREMPEKIPECFFPASYIGNELYQIDITPTLVKEGIVKSNSQIKRLITQRAVELDGKKINNNIINVLNGSILRVGKRNFVRITVK